MEGNGKQKQKTLTHISVVFTGAHLRVISREFVVFAIHLSSFHSHIKFPELFASKHFYSPHTQCVEHRRKRSLQRKNINSFFLEIT
jgi:hypothetical protein